MVHTPLCQEQEPEGITGTDPVQTGHKHRQTYPLSVFYSTLTISDTQIIILLKHSSVGLICLLYTQSRYGW